MTDSTETQEEIPLGKMEPELKDQWFNAMRTTHKDRKGRGLLHRQDGTMCCLGVLKDITGAKWKLNKEGSHYKYAKDNMTASLTEEELRGYGINESMEIEIWTINDKSDSFEPVIDYLETIL